MSAIGGSHSNHSYACNGSNAGLDLVSPSVCSGRRVVAHFISAQKLPTSANLFHEGDTGRLGYEGQQSAKSGPLSKRNTPNHSRNLRQVCPSYGGELDYNYLAITLISVMSKRRRPRTGRYASCLFRTGFYVLALRRLKPRPTRPSPSSAIEAGSGTLASTTSNAILSIPM